MVDKIKTAVVTGRHPFDVIGFGQLFFSLDGIDAYVQHMEDFATSPADVAAGYEAVVFYNFHRETPGPEGDEWEQAIKGAIESLGRPGQGVVVLHHALLAWPDWGLWSKVVGIEDRRFGYHPGQRIRLEITNPQHPITRGLEPWEITDETYTMNAAGRDSDILLTTKHDKSMRTIAWTRQFKESRVFCFESGHDNQTYSDPGFRTVLTRGIQWCAGRS